MDKVHQLDDSAGPGILLTSICPAEEEIDTAPSLRETQPFQFLSDVPHPCGHAYTAVLLDDSEVRSSTSSALDDYHQLAYSAGPGKCTTSICSSEPNKDTAPPLSGTQPFQFYSDVSHARDYTRNSTTCFGGPTGCTLSALTMDEMDRQLDNSVGPGKCSTGICPAEAEIDTAPRLSGPQLFQLPTDDPHHSDHECPAQVPEGISIYYQNVRGLRTKIDDFYAAASDQEYDVIILTETWLHDAINSVQLFGHDYTVYRKDRNPDISGKSRGGGVLIAVKNSLNSSRCKGFVDPGLELLWINIDCNDQNVCLGAVYISPEQSKNRCILDSYISSISSVVMSAELHTAHLLFGDFNLPDLCRRLDPAGFAQPEPTESVSSSIALIDGMSLLNMRQLNVARNSLNRTLDLLFVSDEILPRCDLVQPPEALIPVDLFHPPLLVIVRCVIRTVFLELADDRLLDFSRANFSRLNDALLSVDWSPLYNESDVNNSVRFFTETLTQLFPEFVPAPRPRQKPPWSNNHLRHLKRKRASALREYSNNRNPITKAKFNTASSKYKNLNRVLYGRYVVRKQEALKNNPKGFWAFVNEKRKENGLPSSMYLGDKTAATNQEMCNLFSEHFASAFDHASVSQDQIDSAITDVPFDAMCRRIHEFDNDDILHAIRKLKLSNTPGPDGIPSAVIIKCAVAVCDPLRSIFNKSISQAVFPECWKKSIMFPTHKKGDKRDISNYRGVTSLSAGSKLLEILVTNVLFRSARSYISQDQHGFYPGRSTATNLVQFTSLCLNSMEKGVQVDAIYTDLKAAFDKVNHRILLAKLDRLGVATNIVKWMRSYLNRRQLIVKLGANESVPFSNCSGVPQGSNLGPLLFSLYFNDVCFVVPEGCRLGYADDFKIYWLVKSGDDCRRLQTIVDSFACWCQRNCLIISVKKCSVISFTRKKNPISWNYHIDNEPVERANVVKDLGVMLDSELNFREHYVRLINKANRNLGFIFRLSSEFRDPYCLRSLYFSLVRSVLETAAIVWSPAHNVWIGRIERVQSKFIKYALRFLPWQDVNDLPPYESRCRLLGMDTLERRRNSLRIVFVAKTLLGEIDAPWILARINMNVIPRPLRQRSFLRLQSHRTDYAQNEPIRSMCELFNLFYDLFDFNVVSCE